MAEREVVEPVRRWHIGQKSKSRWHTELRRMA